LAREAAGEAFERFGRYPDAASHRVQVCKHAKDAVAMRGPRGKSVHVGQIVSRRQPRAAARFLDGPVTGEILGPMSRVLGNPFSEEVRGPIGIRAQDSL